MKHSTTTETTNSDLAIKNLLRRGLGLALHTSEEDQPRWAEIQLEVKMYNRTIPGLRLELPEHYVPLEVKTCFEHYYQFRSLRCEKDAAHKIAGLLSSFQQRHPLEWRCSGWKNDAIAGLLLGEFDVPPESVESRRQAGERWLRDYWQREEKRARETAIALRPKRIDASAAVLDLEMLLLMVDNPQLWICPGPREYDIFVKWLNRNWAAIATKKKGEALLNDVIRKFHPNQKGPAFRECDLREMCDVYREIESWYPPAAVPTYQLVLTLVARKHNVSPRLVTKIRAEMNKHRHSQPAFPPKART
jgi:hypothetical protein